MSVMNRMHVTGLEELDKKLMQLKSGVANKIARPALAKGARRLVKAIKAKVPPNIKAAKQGIGYAVDHKGGQSRNQQRVRVGAGVGIKAERMKKLGDKQKFKRAGTGGGGHRGVGIGPANIHWAILGADGSSQGGPPRTHKSSGKSVGVMKPLAMGLIKDTAAAMRPEILAIIRDEVTLRLEILARKNG